MSREIQLDDIVFFQDIDREICRGVVIGMNLRRTDNHVIITVEKIHPVTEPLDTKESPRYAEATIDKLGCFLSVSALKEYICQSRQAELDVYREQIQSVNDLMNFVLNNDISGKSFRIEHDHPEAIWDIENKRIVFVEKAEELLGISNLPMALPNTESE